MPKVNNVGYGAVTPVKLSVLGRILSMHLAVTDAVMDKYPSKFRLPYRYLEFTAGRGFTPNHQRGSTLLFLDRVHSGTFRHTYQAEFIDREQDNLNALEQTVTAEAKKNQWGTVSVRYQPYDYQAVVPLLFPDRDIYELGLVFVDHSGDVPEWHTLKLIAHRRPKMEILVYISSTAVKRVFQYTGKKLADHMNFVGKKYWLIRKPEAWDKHKWTFLLGADTDIFKKYKAINFYRHDSPEGEAAFTELNLTEGERISAIQPRLEGL
jgi:three-Cys-motif partner protein